MCKKLCQTLYTHCLMNFTQPYRVFIFHCLQMKNWVISKSHISIKWQKHDLDPELIEKPLMFSLYLLFMSSVDRTLAVAIGTNPTGSCLKVKWGYKILQKLTESKQVLNNLGLEIMGSEHLNPPPAQFQIQLHGIRLRFPRSGLCLSLYITSLRPASSSLIGLSMQADIWDENWNQPSKSSAHRSLIGQLGFMSTF